MNNPEEGPRLFLSREEFKQLFNQEIQPQLDEIRQHVNDMSADLMGLMAVLKARAKHKLDLMDPNKPAPQKEESGS